MECLEKAVEEGDVVGPFLEGCIEQGESSFDAGSVLAVVLVLRRNFVCPSPG